jgi:hypothetical protein
LLAIIGKVCELTKKWLCQLTDAGNWNKNSVTAKRVIFIAFLFMWTKVAQNIPNLDNYFVIKSLIIRLYAVFLFKGTVAPD